MSGASDSTDAAREAVHGGVNEQMGALSPSGLEPTSGASVGLQLRIAREAKGMSRAEVANSLKLGQRQVDALEEDDWASFSCTTIIRGFVRNYARLLGLNPEPLMLALRDSRLPSAPELKMTTGAPVSMPSDSSVDRGDYAKVVFGLLVLALAAFAYLLLPPDILQSAFSALKSSTTQKTLTVGPAGNVVPVDSDVEVKSLDVAPVESSAQTDEVSQNASGNEVPAGGVETMPIERAPAEALPVVPLDAAVQSAAPAAREIHPTTPDNPLAAPVPPATASASLPVVGAAVSGSGSVGVSIPKDAASSSAPLVFDFEQPSWVEVRDGRGQIVFSQLSPASTQREVSGQAPFSIVIGNATHVALKYEGRAVDLSKRSKDDVARITVGQ